MRSEEQIRLLRFGSPRELPKRQLLHAGPLTAVLEDGMLRYIKYGDTEVLRGIYAAVRDRNWGTVEPEFVSYKVTSTPDSFDIQFTAHHVNEEIDFKWDGRIVGQSDGSIRFTLDGIALCDFLKNRIGFCVLHPMDLAGTEVQVETANGHITSQFPTQIAPHQPFFDMVAIRHHVKPEVQCEVRFEGDLFEMEDQRNWTDASYKTYCTPLRLAYPAQIRSGEKVSQSVTLKMIGQCEGAVAVLPEEEQHVVHIGETPLCTFPSLGLGVTNMISELGEAGWNRLEQLPLGHLFIEIDLTQPQWIDILRQTQAAAERLKSQLQVAILTTGAVEELTPLMEFISSNRTPLKALFVFSISAVTTNENEITAVCRLRDEWNLDFAVGGGSRAYFTQLNRSDIPPEAEAVMYTVNPQVHAFDNASIVETLAAQSVTVDSALALTEKPLSIGPITLKPRFNPDATVQSEVCANPSAEFDPRLRSLFGAGWTIGSIHRLARPGVSSLTYFQADGASGLVEHTGEIIPAYYVFANLKGFSSAEVLPVRLSHPLEIETLALRHNGITRIFICSFSDRPLSIKVMVEDFKTAQIRYFDETNDSYWGEQSIVQCERQGSHKEAELKLQLQPYAFACIDISM